MVHVTCTQISELSYLQALTDWHERWGVKSSISGDFDPESFRQIVATCARLHAFLATPESADWGSGHGGGGEGAGEAAEEGAAKAPRADPALTGDFTPPQEGSPPGAASTKKAVVGGKKGPRSVSRCLQKGQRAAGARFC
jgi:hypothetical protein